MQRLIQLCYHHLLCAVTIAYICGLLLANQLLIQAELSLGLGICCILLGAGPLRRYAASKLLLLLFFFLLLGSYQYSLSSIPPNDPAHVFHHIQDQEDVVAIGRIAAMPTFDGTTSMAPIQLAAIRFPQSPELTRTQGIIQLRMRSPWPDNSSPGTLLAVRTTLQRPSTYRTPGVFDYPAYLAQKDIWLTGFIRSPAHIAPVQTNTSPLGQLRYLPQRWRMQFGHFIDEAVPAPFNGLYRAVLIGDRSRLEPHILEGFKASGTMHILAISGVHMGLIATLVFSCIYWLLRRSDYLINRWPLKKVAAILCLPPLAAYGLLAGMNAPVLRSLLMSVIVLLAICSDRRKTGSALLGGAALLMLLIDPLSLFTASFQLSFAAVAAIFLALPRITTLIQPPSSPDPGGLKYIAGRFGNWLMAGLLISLAAIGGTAPLSIYYFNRFSLAGPIANLLLEPLICLWALVLGILAVPCSLLLPSLGAALLRLGTVGLDLAISINDVVASFSFTSLWFATPPLYLLCTYYLLLTLMVIYWNKGGRVPFGLLGAAALTVILFFVPLPEATKSLRSEPTTTFIDVGHGSATLIELPGGHRLLIDGGGSSLSRFSVGERVIAPFLWSKGITTLDTIIITHPDGDHYNGIPFLVQHFSPNLLWTSIAASDDTRYQSLLDSARKNGARVVTPLAGEKIEIQGSTLTCLANFASGGTNKARDNNNGLVVRLETPTYTILFPGDIDQQMESRLVRAPLNLQSDILLSPHHGSKSSNSEPFLAAVAPHYLIVSASPNRPTLFPAPSLVQRCRQQGLPLLSTAAYGTIEAMSKNGQIQLIGQPEKRENPLRRAIRTIIQP